MASKFALGVMVLVALGVVNACGGSDLESTGSGIKVVATTTQIGALVREIAGEDVELTVLLKAGADAHDYDPSPQAVKKVSEADLVLRNGIGLDDWLDGMVEGASSRERVKTVTDGIEVREGGESHEDEDEDDEAHEGEDEAHEDDPHVWHNPMLAKVMVNNIVAALSEADPERAATFAQRGEAYSAKLDATDAEIRLLIETIPAENRKVVTNHDAFGYFFERYGLEFVGAVIPSRNKDAQASAKDLAALHDLEESEGV